MSRTLGIDLGGARMATTGWALIEGKSRPVLRSAGLLEKARSPAGAEKALLDLIGRTAPAVLAIDAPLTLPPCLSCPHFCRGPSPELCELRQAREIWEAKGGKGNPTVERLCEIEVHEQLKVRPLPTMRIGQIAGRGVALARHIEARTCIADKPAPKIVEVYPRATLAAMARNLPARQRPAGSTQDAAVRRKWLKVMNLDCTSHDGGELVVAGQTHVFDAVVAAYTGWLAPGGLEQPPAGFNVASGWIWFPRIRVGRIPRSKLVWLSGAGARDR